MSTPHDPPVEDLDATTPAESDAHQPTGADYVSDRTFADFPISRELLEGILAHGYRVATPIQAATIEPALAGRDVLARAKTGTGKTAAFAIPTIENVDPGLGYPQALLLAPTRELAQQIASEIEALAAFKPIRTAVLVGGLPMGPQEDALHAGPAIIVGTPGRVLDHQRRRNLDLSRVRIVVLDEADEMVSMGFYEDVTKLLQMTSEDRQILLFSATISRDTERIVRQYLHDPENIILSTDADGVEKITHYAYEAPAGVHKARALLYVIDVEDPDAAIIFCNTREDTSTVASFLDRQGLDVVLLSGELPQSRRTEVMRRVKAGEVRFLVATDVAARGIDIDDITHVFNYSLPQDPTVYMHRIGRTGRIGRQGRAISVISGTDMSTRRSLETVHKVKFVEIPFPDERDAIHKRVERQARAIRGAMGQMVFESYLPTARSLIEREDGPMLIATALKAFFTWDRQRRAALAEQGLATVETQSDAEVDAESAAAFEERSGKGRKGRKREEREERPERGARDDRKGKKGKERGKGDGPRKARAPVADDSLDALLQVGDAGPSLDDLLVADDAADAGDGGGDEATGDAGERSGKSKKRRRRKKKGGGAGGAGGEPAAAAAGDDLDALLSAD